MKPIDKHYLLLQFKTRVYQKNMTEFQSFFEEVMRKAYDDFKKIRPYGTEGDGGNDGYRPSEGIYYQVYSPMNPREKDADAAKKFKDNFNTLKEEWSEISQIKKYYLVFNDKYTGSSKQLEQAKADLKKENPNIDFELFLAEDLEDVFISLTEDQLIALGFDVDSRNALRNVRDYLEKLEVELDRGNDEFVFKTLQNIKNIVLEQNDENLTLDYEIMECRTLQRREEVNEARKKYESILKRHPNDIRAFLYLAEIYLSDKDYEKNEELLKKAEQIDPNHWLLSLQKLIRDYRLGNEVDLFEVDETTFPSDIRAKADHYRIYALLFHKSGDTDKADRFIEQALHLNPEKFANHEIKLAFLIENSSPLINKNNKFEEGDVERLLANIQEVDNRFSAFGKLGARNQIWLNIKRSHILLANEDYATYGDTAKETFDLALKCYFDSAIDGVHTEILRHIELPDDDFNQLLNQVKSTEKVISDNLAQAILLQFIHKNSLEAEAKKFFESIGKSAFVELVEDITNKNYDKVAKSVCGDVHFAVALSVSMKSLPELREKIIKALPNDGSIQKEKLSLLLSYDEGDIEQAFSNLKELDLSQLSYIECRPTFEIAKKKEAWDFVIVILEKLLEHEKDKRTILQMKLDLFTANLNLDRLGEVIKIGESILSSPNEANLLDEHNREIVTAQTAHAWFKRGEYSDALKFVKKYAKNFITYETKIFLEGEIYVKNSLPEDALNAVIEGIKIQKRPSPEEYGRLFLIFTEIGNLMDFKPTPESEISPNMFIKLKDREKWSFLGTGDELDANKIPEKNHQDYLGKKIGDKIVIESKYHSEKTEYQIENILPIDKYILWQCMHHAQKLSLEGAWDAMEIIEVPTTEDGIDPQNLIARLDDQNKRGQEFFDTYCEQSVPLALLAVSEGSLPNAIGRIGNEQRGFIRSNAGTVQEMEEQKEIARQIINGQEFYLDGTSALFLSETGLLKKIYDLLPGLKVPQSVVSLLLDLSNRFSYSPGQTGHMRYAQERLVLEDVNTNTQKLLHQNFKDSIEMLELRPESIEVISAANKSTELSEKDVPASLCDACILSQRDNIPIVTEDFLYLQMNELQTKKKAPKYCSAYAIVRVLYEQGKISFSEYLDFFYYLSSYRFRLLPINSEDLETAIFGDGSINTISVEQLKKFNFALTLSEEYGVPLETATKLVAHFLIKLIIDDTIPPEVVEKAFAEIIESFPTQQDKRAFGNGLLNACVRVINIHSRQIVLGTRIQEKIDLLSQFIRFYNSGNIILP